MIRWTFSAAVTAFVAFGCISDGDLGDPPPPPPPIENGGVLPNDGGPQAGGGGGGAGGGGGQVDACVSIREIVVASGSGAATGTTAGQADLGAGSCGGQSRPDVRFRFTTQKTGTLVATVRPSSTSFQPVLYVRRGCGDSQEVANGCVAARSAGTTAVLVLPDLEAGTYEVWVDGVVGAGAFDLSVALGAVTGDSCAAPVPIPLTGGGATVVGTTQSSGLTNQLSASCSSAAPDLVHSVDVPAGSDLLVSIVSQDPWRPAVVLQGACGSTELACQAGADAGIAAGFTAARLSAGTHHLWVDSADSSGSGRYELSVTRKPSPNGDTCASAIVLPFDPVDGGVFTHKVIPTEIADDYLTCPGFGGGVATYDRDVAFTFTAAARFNLWADAASTSQMPTLGIAEGQCPGTNLSCGGTSSNFNHASLSRGDLAPGTYTVWLDGLSATQSAVDVGIRMFPVLEGDTCNNPTPLAFGPDGGYLSVSGSTRDLYDNGEGGCGHYGADRVYSFTTTRTFDFRSRITSGTAGYEPAIFLEQAPCGPQFGLLQCSSTRDGAGWLDLHALPAGTYFLWVNGQYPDEGDYTLEAQLTPVMPSDTCQTVTDLAFSDGGVAQASGDTRLVYDDATGSCGGSGSDFVYRFTTQMPLDLRAEASTSTSSHRPVLYLRQGSCGGSELACAPALSAGAPAQLQRDGLTPGTYYLWVDGAGTNADFELVARLLRPGETCGNSIPLDVSSGSATISGTLDELRDDAASSCSAAGSNDIVYSFVTTSVRTLNVTVTSQTAGFTPVVSIRRGTCATQEVACGAAPVVSSAPADRYEVIVERATAASGQFTLSVTLN